jgi:hypothetical protein
MDSKLKIVNCDSTIKLTDVEPFIDSIITSLKEIKNNPQKVNSFVKGDDVHYVECHINHGITGADGLTGATFNKPKIICSNPDLIQNEDVNYLIKPSDKENKIVTIWNNIVVI